jgi:hypothetical protein
MAVLEHPPIYDELLDLLAENVDAKRLIAYRLPAARQADLDALLQKNREGKLTAEEAAELDAFEQLEHVVRLLKARVRRQKAS